MSKNNQLKNVETATTTAPSDATSRSSAVASVALVRAASSPDPPPKLAVGITTFISSTLRKGRPFKIKRPAIRTTGGRISKNLANTGKQIGRFTDHLFSRIVRGQEQLSQTQKNHSRCRDIFKILRKFNCRPIATQVPVNLGSGYRLKTQLDGVGVLPRGEIIVLEIKVNAIC